MGKARPRRARGVFVPPACLSMSLHVFRMSSAWLCPYSASVRMARSLKNGLMLDLLFRPPFSLFSLPTFPNVPPLQRLSFPREPFVYTPCNYCMSSRPNRDDEGQATGDFVGQNDTWQRQGTLDAFGLSIVNGKPGQAVVGEPGTWFFELHRTS